MLHRLGAGDEGAGGVEVAVFGNPDVRQGAHRGGGFLFRFLGKGADCVAQAFLGGFHLALGEEFLGGLQQESRIHIGGICQHRLGLAEKPCSGVLRLGIAGSSDSEFHHQLGVVVVAEDGFFKKDAGGAELAVGGEFVGEF